MRQEGANRMAYAEDHLSDNREAQELSFITPGNSTPYGKSRVFFCGHPEDHAVYLEPVREWIWKYNRNTAFWYEDPEKGSGLPLEELYARLSEMNLIVMPVTTNLLTKTNRAVEVILPYAEEKHIPILPLMMEEGLDELFSNIFGNLQYLKPLEKDPTSVPFEQKLEKYIRGVLIGDEQAQMIRDAFDAYIFLSYRKKDRAYAQELMEMIHRNPRFRDIAIWYDEYLVPGENFNETIRHMLEKSDVFGLVVTPSLLEYMDGAPNYVMANEYPAARACGKPILPMEKAATDRTRLEELYPGIPDCASTEADTEAYLTEQLRGVALAENDEDPQHNFLIGLAYLDGIDVGVDSGKALKLITGAAEAGLEEAIRKLVSIYLDGKGVNRNYDLSVKWQERLVELLHKGYKPGIYQPGDWNYFLAVKDLGDAYYTAGNHRKAVEMYTEMYSIARCTYKAIGTMEARRDLSVSYERLGDTAKALGKSAEAKHWYESNLAIRHELAEDAGAAEAYRDLWVSYIKLGDIEADLSNPKEAKRWYEFGLEISRRIEFETDLAGARRDLSVNYEKLGNISRALGNLTEAKKWYEDGLAISRALVEVTKSADIRRDLFVSYEKLGNVARSLGNLEEAREWYESGLTISRALAEEAGTFEARRDLSVSYEKLGNIAKALGNLSEAKTLYESGLAISADLADETGAVEARRDLLVSYVKLGNIEKNLGNLPEAKKWYESGLTLSRSLVAETATVEARRDLAVIYLKLGDIAKEMDNLETTGSHLKILLKRNSKKQYSEAKGWYDLSLTVSRLLAEETRTMEDLDNLALCHFKLGELGNIDNMKEAYSIWERLAKAYPEISAFRDNLEIVSSKLGR